ncbi:hypothetical protein [Nocardia brasiliensis]|uniref:hypothetical protein n=1 Tax=Nocardia brasiliensis TaxID=37326 RepID=UPI0024575907|nr:hypothetical protein [Nocardia brasiliensis]
MAAERWFEAYERCGRSGMVALMSVTGGLSVGWWQDHNTRERACRDAGSETDYDE